MSTKSEAFERLLKIMGELREKCPWDKKQTIESLRNQTIEETYELADAILDNNYDEIKKELGDVLLHVVFYSHIASETNKFDIEDVINSLCEKLIYRHPHVYGDTTVANSEEVKRNWEELKLKEKDRKREVLGGVPTSLPALIKANRMQSKVKAVGFDWEEKSQVWDKVDEELAELKEEIRLSNGEPNQHVEEEFGDFFFSMVNAARLYHIDPETALEKTNRKFKRRFEYLEQQTLQKGLDLKSMSLDEMNKYWDEAKKLEREGKLE